MVALLHANDRPGAYPQSWYAATAEALPPFAPLAGTVKADVAVIGGGYTGLSAALHLAQAGRDVVLIDAQRVGFGASGRNGGQLGSGQRSDQITLERKHGKDMARALWDLAQDAKGLVKSLIAEHGIDCDLRPGIAHMASRKADVAELHAYAEHLAAHYDYQTEILDTEGARALCPSPDYTGGTLDRDAAHLHPLRFALGLARAAQKAGVRIFERSEARQVSEGVVATAGGRIEAEHIILAANGYGTGLHRKTAAKVMPINNFIIATEPLGARTREVLTEDIAVADSRFVVNYFRLSGDGRLLFGGGESYGYRFPADIAAKARGPMLEIFPHLRDVRIDYAWGGTLAITLSRMPYLARAAPRILAASGYSGHGVGTATHAGWLMAKAVEGETDGFDTLSALPSMPFPGGAALRMPMLVLGMSWYALRDRLGF